MTTTKETSIDLLNKAVADELATINQYMYFHFHLDDQGYAPLANLFKKTAIVEMGHLERFAERILFLKGDVKMVPGFKVEAITDPVKILQKASELEHASAAEYNEFAKKCGENLDAVTKQLFEAILADEEKHYDEFDNQQDFIKNFGTAYLALQSFTGLPPQTSGK